MGDVKPITPATVTKAKTKSLPDAVIEVFNKLIAEQWDGHSAVVMQKDALRQIVSDLNVNPNDVVSRGWLDVEPVYRAAGWRVVYDKPAYCEDYEPTFTFSKKR